VPRLVVKSRTTTRRRLLHVAAPLGHLVLALAVVFGIVRSGGRYFYCEAFGLLPFDPCAEASREPCGKGPSGTLGEQPRDCCAIVTLAATPDGAQAARPSVPPAACRPILPAPGLAARTDLPPPSRVARAFERWRPPPRTANDARTRLMVFLI
jgi:hypothetical protein